MDKQTKISLMKRAAVCLALVLLYGLFGTLLHAGSTSRHTTGTAAPALVKGKQSQ